jgi:hypothetical protein
VTATSKISSAGSSQAASDVLLLGAAGNSGQVIAAELAARGLSLRLAGRRHGPLEDLASALAAVGGRADVRAVDLGDRDSLAEAVAGVGVVLSVVGPFARQAGPVIDACLTAGVSYVDIANEWPAVRGLLDRGEDARARGVALVTGAGFGPAATEALVLRLVESMDVVPARVRVAAAAAVARQSDGVPGPLARLLGHRRHQGHPRDPCLPVRAAAAARRHGPGPHHPQAGGADRHSAGPPRRGRAGRSGAAIPRLADRTEQAAGLVR